MTVGIKTIGKECRTYIDRMTGVEVRQLTRYRGHSGHFYFTNPGWYDNGGRMLFASDRNGLSNLFTIDMNSYEITQITDLPEPSSITYNGFQRTCVDKANSRAYFFFDKELRRLDLLNFRLDSIYRVPDGYRTAIVNVTADGRYVCTSIRQDLPERNEEDPMAGPGFAEYWSRKPHCQIVEIPVSGGSARVLHEDDRWLSHVNTSPTVPELLSFCQEGPWEHVQRIWCFNRSTGLMWNVRPTDPALGERVGHEYWLHDGKRLGYHGHHGRDERRAVFGIARFDGSERVELPIGGDSVHFYSNNEELIVGDGSGDKPFILLWKREPGMYGGPRVLCRHLGRFLIQSTHVHPRFSPDGSYCIFTSEAGGYGQIYKVDIPEFEALRPMDSMDKR